MKGMEARQLCVARLPAITGRRRACIGFRPGGTDRRREVFQTERARPFRMVVGSQAVDRYFAQVAQHELACGEEGA